MRVFLSLIISLSTTILLGQLPDGHLRLAYNYVGTNNLDQPDRKSRALFYLETDGITGFYYDPARRSGDSLWNVDTYSGITDLEKLGKVGSYRKGAAFQAQTNISSGKVTVWDEVGTYFKYEEQIPLQQWQLHSDSQQVMGILCFKATTAFRGRDFVAWYAPSIPISIGPWKFHGLPGAILMIMDAAGHYQFECTNIETVNKKEIPGCIVMDAKSTTLKEFHRLRKQRATAPQEYFQTVTPGITFSAGPGNTNMALQGVKRYNPLELVVE